MDKTPLHVSLKETVAGSNPSGGTTIIHTEKAFTQRLFLYLSILDFSNTNAIM